MSKERAGPAKPSAETEAVYAVLRGVADQYPDLAPDVQLRAMARALVRRFPRLTETPPLGGLFGGPEPDHAGDQP